MDPDFYRIRDCCRRNLIKYTMKAFSSIPKTDTPLILDMGCGTGEPSLALLQVCDGKIFAVDSNKECISVLERKVSELNYADRIEVVCGSIFDENLLQKKFDIVLAEGLLNVIGFETGLRLLVYCLKQNGYLIIHDELKNDAEKRAILKKYGLNLLNTFELSEDVWWNEYYSCLEKLIDKTKDSVFNKEICEINEFKKDPESSRSIYYIAELALPAVL